MSVFDDCFRALAIIAETGDPDTYLLDTALPDAKRAERAIRALRVRIAERDAAIDRLHQLIPKDVANNACPTLARGAPAYGRYLVARVSNGFTVHPNYDPGASYIPKDVHVFVTVAELAQWLEGREG